MPTNVKQIKLLTRADELALFYHAIQSYESDFSSFWIQNRVPFARLCRMTQRLLLLLLYPASRFSQLLAL